MVTFLAEVEGGGHASGFVVAADEVDGLRELELVGEEQRDDLDAVGAAVDEVAQEEVLLARGRAVEMEDVEQVVKLAEWTRQYPWMSPTMLMGEASRSRLG